MSAEEEYEDEYESDSDELVHPLPQQEAGKRVGESDEGAEELKKPQELRRVASVLSATTGSDDGSSESSDERDQIPSVPTYTEEVVRLHARRLHHGVSKSAGAFIPPPAPVMIEPTDVGTEASAEAQRRVAQYRRRKAKQEDEKKHKIACDVQNAKQIRMMYKDFNRSIGVADIPSDARYKDALNMKRKNKQKEGQEATNEVASRWYKKVVRRTRSEYNAADFCARILEDARREHHAKLREKELHRKAINKKLNQLSLEAKSIIAQTTGAYERGSFLLKVPQKKTTNSKRT